MAHFERCLLYTPKVIFLLSFHNFPKYSSSKISQNNTFKEHLQYRMTLDFYSVSRGRTHLLLICFEDYPTSTCGNGIVSWRRTDDLHGELPNLTVNRYYSLLYKDVFEFF